MVDKPEEQGDIKETDIVFDCPYCAKSLAIDYHGAGLSIPCSDCGKLVEVPIPDGMELNDLDSSDEEQEIRIINLRKSLLTAEEKITKLHAEIDELTDRRETLERIRTNNMFTFGSIVEAVGVVQRSIDDINKALAKIVEMSKSQN